MEVCGRPMQDMTLLDAYQVFRNLNPGPVDIVIRRGDNTQVNLSFSFAVRVGGIKPVEDKKFSQASR